MARRIALGLLVVLIAALAGGYLFLRAIASDDAIRRTLQERLADALGQPVRIEGVRLALRPKIGIELTGVAVGDPARARVERVRLATGLRPLLGRRIESAEVIVSNGQIDLPLPPISAGAPPSSGGDAAPSASLGAQGSVTLVSVDTISVNDIRLTSGDRTLVVDSRMALTPDGLEIAHIAAQADELRIEGTGTVTNLWADPHASFDLEASQLDMDLIMAVLADFSPDGSTSGDGGISRPAGGASQAGARAAAAKVTATLAAQAGRVAGVTFTDLKARADVTAGGVVIEPLTFGIFGGRYTGRLTLDPTGPVPTFRWVATLAGVDVARALEFVGTHDAMTGTLSAWVDIRGAGADAAQALRTVRGTGRLNVTDGTIPHLDLVGTVIRALGRPGEQPTGSGEAFSTLGGRFVLAEGVLTSGDLTMESRDLDVDGAGTVSLATGTMDLRTNLRLSEELTRRLGTDAARATGESARFTVPAVIQGEIDQPSVKVDTTTLVKKALTRELQDQLKKGIGRLFKKKGGGSE